MKPNSKPTFCAARETFPSQSAAVYLLQKLTGYIKYLVFNIHLSVIHIVTWFHFSTLDM